MNELRSDLLHCRELLDSAMSRLPDLPRQDTPLAFEAQDDSDSTPHGAD